MANPSYRQFSLMSPFCNMMRVGLFAIFLGLGLTFDTHFPFESTPLTESDTEGFSVIGFGDPDISTESIASGSKCRAFPGEPDWPSEAQWAQLNTSLEGALLYPTPAGSACYPGDGFDVERCNFLVQEAGRTSFWINDPLNVLAQWPQGSTCMANVNATGECTRGGFPEYVVNVTTVKHVQAAVNFARNKNIRVVIK